MGFRTSAKTTVEGSPEQPWAVLSDVGTWRSWYAGLNTFELIEGDFGLGAAARMKEWIFRYEAIVTVFDVSCDRHRSG